jgi:hypothetical protein
MPALTIIIIIYLCEKLCEVEGISAGRGSLFAEFFPLKMPAAISPCFDIAGAADLAAANRILRRFLPDYIRRFGRADPAESDRICCLHPERLASNDNVVQREGHRSQIQRHAQRFRFAGARVQLYDSRRKCFDLLRSARSDARCATERASLVPVYA